MHVQDRCQRGDGAEEQGQQQGILRGQMHFSLHSRHDKQYGGGKQRGDGIEEIGFCLGADVVFYGQVDHIVGQTRCQGEQQKQNVRHVI